MNVGLVTMQKLVSFQLHLDWREIWRSTTDPDSHSTWCFQDGRDEDFPTRIKSMPAFVERMYREIIMLRQQMDEPRLDLSAYDETGDIGLITVGEQTSTSG